MKNVRVIGDKIIISFPYDVKLRELIKRSLPGRAFDRSTKQWWLPARPYNALRVIDLLEPHGFEFSKEVEVLGRRAIAIQQGSVKTTTGRKRSGLYPFQSVAVDFLNQCDGRVLIGDDMGLGKTVVSLWWIESRETLGRVLVVAPANVIYKWEDEVFRWTSRTPQIIETRKQAIEDESDLHICSYSIMNSRWKELKAIGYDLIIFDECHYLKNYKAQRTESAKRISGGVPHILALSGTPFLNRPAELWPNLHILDSQTYAKFWQFGDRYCGGHKTLYKLATRRDELQERMKSVMIRRLKSEVLEQLPDLTRTIIPLELRSKWRSIYKKVKRGNREAILSISPGHKGYFDNPLDRLNLLQLVIGLGKSEAASGWITNFLDSTDRQLVIYCHHKRVVALVEKIVKERYGVITGDVPAKRRARIVEKFQSGLIRTLIITGAGGEGIDLYAASDILFIEREYTPAREEQAEARLHRIGQVNGVNAYYLMAIRTVDEDVARLIDQKRIILNDIVGTTDIEVSIIGDLLETLYEDHR